MRNARQTTKHWVRWGSLCFVFPYGYAWKLRNYRFVGVFLTAFWFLPLLSSCGGGGGGTSQANGPNNLPLPPAPQDVSSIEFTLVADAGFNRRFSADLDRLSDEERFGGGIAAGDIDNDSDIDLYIVGRDTDPNHLYINRGDGTFEERGQDLGVGVLHWGSGPAFGDIDGDGDLDLFVGAVADHPVYLFENRLNELDGKFHDITAAAGLRQKARNTVSALFYDYDRDGFLDLILSHWGEYWNPGSDTGTLWRNNGDNTFTSMSIEAGIADVLVEDNTDWSFTPGFSDLDQDGDGDLFMASDFGESQIFRNNDDGTFTKITNREVIIDQNGMGSALGDFDNDGDMDWFVTSIYDLDGEGGSSYGNRLYRNVGRGIFQDATLGSNVGDGDWGWGTCAGDFDNDGFLDLVEVNGWVTSSHKNFRDRPVRFYYNLGLGHLSFQEIHAEVNLNNLGQGRALACFDADRDGDLDIVLVNGSPDHIVYYRNDTPRTQNYLGIALNGLGANRFGVGARIEVTTSVGTQIRELGSNNNFTSHNPQEVHFGLGHANTANVLVVWPDQSRTELSDVRAQQLLRITATESNLRLIVTNGTGTGSYGLGERVTIQARPAEDGYFFSHWSSSGEVEIDDPFAVETTVVMPHSTVSIQANYVPGVGSSDDVSIARRWNEVLLQAIRNDYARPTVHARNLFHVSAAMYDAWVAHRAVGRPWLLGSTQAGTHCAFDATQASADSASERAAISMAAYRIIRSRFANSPGANRITRDANALLEWLGYDHKNRSTDYVTDPGVGLGNYIAQCYLTLGLQDRSNEVNDYANMWYEPTNPPLEPHLPGNPNIQDLNRWQPLALLSFIDQAGNIADSEPEFLSPEWGQIWPFALRNADRTVHQRDGFDYWVYHDPGSPPTLGGDTSQAYKWGFELVAHWASHLDPNDGVAWDISPRSLGNVQTLPQTQDLLAYQSFYDAVDGGDLSTGYAVNPSTGNPYESQIVPRGDYTRVLAEFWADGPDSETPPGHWFVILNEVNQHAEMKRQFEGRGATLPRLEWDIKAYFALGGAMHDAAISAWGIKGWYDYIRPISALRAMADLGQSSDAGAPSYHVDGLPLTAGLVELVGADDALAGTDLEHVNKVKLRSWKGPDYIEDASSDVAGVAWILAENWWPYQLPSFVTPPFAGYVSGHSTYSRAAAEVLTAFTGDAFFPGGMSSFEVAKDTFLRFERGPSVDLVLQWATYYDAADQCSLSRIWGGIHPPADDIPGRFIGVEVGRDAFAHAKRYFQAERQN